MKRILFPVLKRALTGAALLAITALPAAAQDAAPGRAKPFAVISSSAQSVRDSLVAMARAQVGKPYRIGGRSPERGFDCSGLVQYLMAVLQREVPRTAARQAGVGMAVERDTSRLRPGDLLTFGVGTRTSHVGIYIGDGRYVHASSVAGRVVVSPIHRRAERVAPWRGARRVIAAAGEESR
ncbi:MAG: C40 family peptidase [Gemmatimonadaceae bacterium]|nr:C40 family peptidase [Gemmatimonadaceae bacterium]